MIFNVNAKFAKFSITNNMEHILISADVFFTSIYVKIG